MTSLLWQNCTPGSWVMIMSGPYKGDVGLIIRRHKPSRYNQEPMQGRHKSKGHPRVIVVVVPRLFRPTTKDQNTKPNTLKQSRAIATRPTRERFRWWNNIDNSPGFDPSDWHWVCEEHECSDWEVCPHYLYVYCNHIINHNMSRTVELVTDICPLRMYDLTPDDPFYLSDHPFVKENLHKLPTPNNWHFEIGEVVSVLRHIPVEPDLLQKDTTMSVIADETYPQGTITEILGRQCVVTCDVVVEGEEIVRVDGKNVRVRTLDGKQLLERLWSREADLWDIRKVFKQDDGVTVRGGRYEGLEGLVIDAGLSKTSDMVSVHVVNDTHDV
ncbi:hypothetical protein AAF712_016446, partial [Marasmius tenuissimus]